MNEKEALKEINSAFADRTITVLNRALDEDANAIYKLMEYRVSCTNMLANDLTIQVLQEDDQYKIGILGLINGILGIKENGMGHISAKYGVVCPAALNIGSHHGWIERMKVGDPCPTCNEKLILGNLIKFMRTPND